MREKLLSWNYFLIGKSNDYTCPLQHVAVFIHDFPIETEKHPMPKILLEMILNGHTYCSRESSEFVNTNLMDIIAVLAE